MEYILLGTEELKEELPKNEAELLNCYKQLDHRGQSRVTSTAFEELERIEAAYQKESKKFGAQAV